MPTIFYVATLAEYVLVAAENEAEARELGRLGLIALRAERGHPAVQGMPVEIRTARSATSDEIELERWNREMLDRDERHLSPGL